MNITFFFLPRVTLLLILFSRIKEEFLQFFFLIISICIVLQKNIVHRDLKLGNMMLNKRSRRITITNFCLGKHLVSENDYLKDQRGSPAYISPDVLSGKSMCGVGVVWYCEIKKKIWNVESRIVSFYWIGRFL